jgi:mRNA interferase HigB
VRIFTEQPLMEFICDHPETKTALQEWASVAKKSQWTCFEDVKDSFTDVSSMGDQQYIFKLLGDRCRLIAVINFTIQLINIRSLGTTTA